jgi:hypothetical protein
MATKIQVRRDTAANWTSANTVLSSGEMGYETDTGYMKIGDGTTNWSSLSYFTPGDVSDDNTTYTISVAQSGGDANVTLTGSDASNDTVTMVAGNNLTVTVAGDNVTMDVDNDLANYSNATSQFLTDITAQAIGSLTDVNVSAVADGSVLAYDQGSGNWVAGDPAVGALDDLSDVTLGTPSTGNLLHYNGANWEASSSPMSTLNLGTLRVSGTTGQDYTSFGTLTGTDGGIITHAGNVTAGAMWYHADTDYDFVANFDSVFLNASESCKLTIIINNDQEGRDTICTGIQFNGFDKLDVQWASGAAPTVGTLGGYDIIEFTVVNNATNSLSNLGETDIQDNVYVFADHKANVSQSLAGLSDVDVYALFPSSSEPVSGSFLTYDTVENKWEASQGFLPKIYMDRGSFVNRQGFLYNVGFYDEENILTGTDGDVLEFNLDTEDVDNRIKSAGIYYIESIDYNFIANFDRAAYDGNVSYNANTRSKGQKNFRLIVDNRSRSQTRIQGSSKQSTIFTTGLTIVLNGVTVTNSGGTLGQFVEDINTAAIPNVRAFNQNSYIHLVGDGVDIEIDAASTGLAELYLTAGTYTQTTYGSGNKGPIGYQMKGKSLDVKYHNGVAPTPKAGEVNIYDIEIVEDQSFNGDPEYTFAFVKHWNESADIVGGVFTGDLKGSVAADDSTVLIDGTEGTINLDGTVSGNIDVPSGNLTLQSGTANINGNLTIENGNNIVIEKSVSANNETLGKITATTGSVDYGEIEFKTGADGFADNSEINWYARIGGAKTAVFEIKGTSLGKSGFEINPTGSASLDFFMQSSGDPTLIFADAGDDRVGFGKIPTQGKVDVDGDVYATTFVGALAFSNLTSTPTTLAGYGITDAATSAQGALADTAVQPAALGNIEFGTGTIDTNDSSAVTITPAVIMSSDATVENSLTVTNTITADTVTGKIVATAGTAPTVATEAGEIGEIRFDNTNMYLKCPDGNWRRVALSGLV